jgi:hypothetical protein
MTWITWRQHRAALTGFALLFGGFAVLMLYAGVRVHDAYHTLVQHGCSVASPVGPCGQASALFLGQPFDLYPNGVALALHVSPVLIGMFLGAPLLAREYEAGTLRFAWTQGTGRTRWLLAQLTLLAVPVAAVSCGLAALASWSSRPFEALGYATRWQAGQFDTTMITAVGWALAGFALGALLGAVIKRTVAAMAVSAAAVTALAAAAYAKLDYLLLSVHPRTVADPSIVPANVGQGALKSYAQQSYPVPRDSWLVRGWFAGPTGRPIGHAALSALNRVRFGSNPSAAQLWLTRHHVTFLVAYQPAAHYWPFQAAAGGILLLAAAALAAATLLLIRRRA